MPSWIPNVSNTNNSAEITPKTDSRKMSGIRGPKRKAMEAEMGEKRSKLEEEEATKVEMVKQEVDETSSYRCPLCSLELNCMPGDRVMKRHIMDEHFTPGSLLEMVGLDLEDGQKLR